MDIEIVTYVLAIALGAVCWRLVKHTADEYDRWYEQPRSLSLAAARIPATAISLLLVFGAFLLLR